MDTKREWGRDISCQDVFLLCLGIELMVANQRLWFSVHPFAWTLYFAEREASRFLTVGPVSASISVSDRGQHD